MDGGLMADFTFHHGGVSVPDLEAAIGWYGDVLGYQVERRFFIDAANAKAAMIRKGALRFELFEVAGAAPLPEDRRDPPADLRTHGNKHVAFRINDLDAFLAEVTARGADVAFVVREDFGSGCFLRDCAGNLIEFVTEGAPENRAIMEDFVRLFYAERRVADAFERHVAPDYIQHNPNIADGRDAAIAFLEPKFGAPGARFDVKRLLVDSELAVVHLHGQPDPATPGVAVADFYRLEGGKIVEHWDVLQPVMQGANPRTMV
jgi:predicted SnoaL-like aldol condensation-catalyzing enzyme/catechol 2,3-dioxygenase-like lactoylglutathione lyase family enzyme